MRNGEIRAQRTFLLTFTTASPSVMLSESVAWAGLGFMRNNDGSKIAVQLCLYIWFKVLLFGLLECVWFVQFLRALIQFQNWPHVSI